MWAAIKKAINATLGRKNFKSLDEIISRNSYSNYYDTMRAFVTTYGDGGGKIVVIPRGTTEIESGFLHNNSTVETVVMPLGLETIGGASIKACQNLKHVIIPSGVTSIGTTALALNTAMEEVRVPKSVTSIAHNAFYGTYGDLYLEFSEGEVDGAPWGFDGTIHYDCD